jgi:hypothetical protein
MFFKNLYRGRWCDRSVIFKQSKSLLLMVTQLIGVFIGRQRPKSVIELGMRVRALLLFWECWYVWRVPVTSMLTKEFNYIDNEYILFTFVKLFCLTSLLVEIKMLMSGLNNVIPLYHVPTS